MDVFGPVATFFIVFVFITLLCMCCKRRRDQGTVLATPVVITSTQHHVGPYPVTQTVAPPLNATQQPGMVVMQQHPTGTGMYPAQQMPQPMPGFNPAMGGAPYPPQQAPYPSYQQQQQQQMPMPGSAPGMPPLPVQANMNPPSYDQVVTEGYARQAPFNPHFTGGQ